MFSQYVIKAIEEISSAKLIDKHTAVTQLRNAAERAESSQDTDILKTISGVLSMGYSFESNSYEPMFVMSTGARSFSIDDIRDEDIAILENALEMLLPTWACAQLADILCIKCSFAQYGRLAVSEYLNLFDETFDPDNWVDCWDVIRRAFDIAVRQGKNSDPFMQVKTHINQTLYRLDGCDPLFLSLNLVQLIYKYASNDELENYLEIASKIFNKHIADQDNECYVIEDAFQTQETLLKQLKREHDIHDVKRRLALFYENLADRLKIDGWNGAHRAINALQKACKLYNKNSDQGKVLEIRKQIEELQRTAFSGISGVPFKIDTTSLYNNVNKLFHGLTLQEMIVQLGRTVLIYQKDDVKQRVLEEHQKYIFKSMFGSRFVDKNHRVVSNIPPLDFHNPEADQELLHKHMVQYVNRNWEVAMSISLGYAWNVFRGAGPISPSDVDFLVANNPIIPDGRSAIIKTGLYTGLSGDLYASMHILLPQTENIFRNLVSMCGDVVTFLKEDGTEEYKPLTQLFKSEKLKECYDENIIFTFQSIMDDKAGINLRNLNAHGLLEPELGNSGIALCFLCLLIRFISIYSRDASKIIAGLSERDADILS